MPSYHGKAMPADLQNAKDGLKNNGKKEKLGLTKELWQKKVPNG